MDHADMWPAARVVFVIANLTIAAGYGAIPAFVLPYIRLPRTALILGAGFFALCGLTHVGMAFSDDHMARSWWWVAEHVAQSVCTWGFIVVFGGLLRTARGRLRSRAGEPAEALP